MKKIAIIGAPSSGKSELAEALAKEFENATIIDNYIDEIGREADLAMGEDASYIGNLYAVLGRYAKERNASQDNQPEAMIVCGTLVESSVYATIEALRYGTELHMARVTEFMRLLGLLIQDTWDYDYVFRLKLEDPDENTIEGRVDGSITMALNAFGISHTTLEGSVDERVKQALEAIEKRDRELKELEAVNSAFIQGTPPPLSD